MSTVTFVGGAFSYLALTIGLFFFLFACKYYVSILVALFIGRGKGEGHEGGFNGLAERVEEYGKLESEKVCEEPFVSIQLPFYNERNVARRIIKACIDMDYTNYEILVADDSRDETLGILKELSRRAEGPTVKVVHRNDRSGFKGGALQKAVESMDPRTEYIVVFDADFIPPPDILKRFLWYFEASPSSAHGGDGDNHRFGGEVLNHYKNGGDLLGDVDDWYRRKSVGVVQGYQLHHLNKSENWITKGIRAEFSGGYMIERASEEFFGAMKMITGSVFMIRAEIVKKLGWTHSITEDWDLTLRMYMEGYKVLYTPLIQAPAEIPKTVRAVVRQRMRWAEGHTFAVKKYFMDILRSPKISLREKLEFLYFAPYYLQSFFFLAGTFFWLVAEIIGRHPGFWTAVLGWSLILSNLFSLPLMSLSGLYLERSATEDMTGIFSMIVLSYVLTPFQAYAAIKGLLERDEGGWIRTLKTGSITDRVLQIRIRRLFSWIVPEREAPKREGKSPGKQGMKPLFTVLLILLVLTSFIVWVTASAMSVHDKGMTRTALTLEYLDEVVEINGISTNRILTHPDYLGLGTVMKNDTFIPSPQYFEKAWGYYLYGPLEEVYRMKGGLKANLYLYADDSCEVDLRIKVLQLDDKGREKKVISYDFDNVDLEDDVPEEALEFDIDSRRAKRFDEGDSILVEIWLRANEANPPTINLAYDSKVTPSDILFPGIVMPESLLPLIFCAPLIPLIVRYLSALRQGELDYSSHRKRGGGGC